MGLDHVIFSAARHANLEIAMRICHGVLHGEIKALGAGLGLYVLAVCAPDNIQIELTTFYA